MSSTGARALVARIDPSPEFARDLIAALSERLEEDWIKPGEFARRVGVHPNTVRNWVNEGRIEALTLPSGYVKVKASDADRLLSSKQKGA